MSIQGKTTKLEAVNTMLGFIGEAPMASLEENTGVGDAPVAEKVLDEINREIQAQGWLFNTEFDVEFAPAANKELIFSDDIVRVDLERSRYPTIDVTLRGNKLYNRSKNTYEFEDKITGEQVKILGWDDLPELARRYITLRAARVLQDRQVGAEALTQVGVREELAALATLREYDSETSDSSIFDAYLPASTVQSYRR